MTLEARGLRKAYDGHVVLDGFSHVFPRDRVTAILGRSGCGKTTLLRLIAGLEAPDSGQILGVPGDGLSMVFQEDRLPLQLSAAGCLRCVLKKSADREANIAQALAALGIAEPPTKAVDTLPAPDPEYDELFKRRAEFKVPPTRAPLELGDFGSKLHSYENGKLKLSLEFHTFALIELTK